MTYLSPAPQTEPLASHFGFAFDRTAEGWRWTTFDALGRVAAEGMAPNKAIAAACVIRELART